MGCLNILQDSLDKISQDEARELISTALGSGSHMVHLLNDILARSKNRFLSTVNRHDKEPYVNFAKSTVDGMRSIATNTGVNFTLDVTPVDEDCFVVLDRTKVTQVITNLVNNALKFASGPGSSDHVDVQIKLLDSLEDAVVLWEIDAALYECSAFVMHENEVLNSVEEVKEKISDSQRKIGAKWFCASVKDSGIGMKTNELAKMFEPYTQGCSSRNGTTVKGTGLGLYICASLCHRMEGFIACSSTYGNGTVFHVGLPVDVVSAETVEREKANVVAANDEGAEIVMMGPILIVDDNKVNLKVLERQ